VSLFDHLAKYFQDEIGGTRRTQKGEKYINLKGREHFGRHIHNRIKLDLKGLGGKDVN
jgi:hypothetical protein